MGSLLQLLRNMGQARLVIFLLTAIGLTIFFVFISLRLSAPGLTTLYSDLSLEDSAKIVQQLETLNVKYELRANGAQVLVPSDQVLRLRLTLAQQGLPTGGSMVGYEIFDRTEAMGTSNFVLNINMLRALEGELARTISSLSKIESARVHLVIPKHELFSKEQQDPTASVVLKLRGGELEKEEIRAIGNLVASAVPGLKTQRVTIVDSQGRLLARGEGDGDESHMQSGDAQEYRITYENRMRSTLESLLEQTLGPGKAKVQVHADIDFDRIVTNAEKYDPDGQVARSTQSNEEKETSSEPGPNGTVSAANNLPGGAAAQGGGNSSHVVEKTNETTNFEISKTVENHVKEVGNVKKLSVAVLVDGVYTKDASGNDTYTPRPDAEIQQLTQLVRSAMGYDESRGDKVEVVSMRFAPVEGNTSSSTFAWVRENLSGAFQSLMVGIVAILGILYVVRPLAIRLAESVPVGAASIAGIPGMGAMPSGMMGSPGAGGGERGEMREEEPEEAMIDLEQVRGRVKSSSVRKINDLVDTQPDETLTIIRSWMNKD